MPDQGLRRLHRFRGHAVAGVNWRPTRFADEVPSSRVCGLCGMIPKRTVLLPCSHALCQSCHASSLGGGVAQCPLDQEPFEEEECVGYEFPTRKVNTLKCEKSTERNARRQCATLECVKRCGRLGMVVSTGNSRQIGEFDFGVYCWNEAHGCGYTGTMDSMLEHYENECTFHSVECSRCGEGVQHRDLPTHYRAGCIAGAPSAITECSEPTAPTLKDVSAALEDLKAMLADPKHDQLLPVIQSQLNELTEQVRNQEVRFGEITRDVGASERNLRSEMAQIITTIASSASHRLTSQQNRAEGASMSSSVSWRSEKELILRKLEHLSEGLLYDGEHPHQISPQHNSSRLIAYCALYIPRPGIRHLTSALSMAPTHKEAVSHVVYRLSFENCDELIQWRESSRKFAEITVWHMRDTYFTLAIWKHSSCLSFEVKFYGILVDSKCWPAFWRMSTRFLLGYLDHSLICERWTCDCEEVGPSFVHFHLKFSLNIDSLGSGGLFRDRRMMLFYIELDENDRKGGVRGTP